MLEENYVRAKAAAILLVLMSFSVHSQQPTAPSKPDEPATGTLDGRVVNESGQPLVGAAVYVRAVGLANLGRTTVTDSDGNFQISGLDPAAYTVSALLPAYTTIPRDPDDPTNYYRAGDSVRLQLIKGGIITGTVTTVAGDPVVAVRVRAYLVRDANGRTPKSAIAPFGERSTDDRGVYRIFGLAPGTYLVYAGGSGFGMVNAYDSDTPTYAPSSTRDTAAPIVVRAGEESNVDIRYRGEPGHTVSGTVRVQGSTGASLMLVPAGSGFLPAGNTFQPPGSRGFSFSGVSDGDYDLMAQETISPQGAYSPEIAVSEPQRITVKGADITGIEMATKPLLSISGRIALESSRAPECERKRRPLFAETLVSLKRNQQSSEKEHLQFLRFYAIPALPDKEGAFVLHNVPAGQYTFSPRFFAHYWYLQSIFRPNITPGGTGKAAPTNQRIDAARNWTTVKPGDHITGLAITLAEGAGSLRGQVTAQEGARLPARVSVYLVPAEREKADDVLRFFAAAVSDDGSFALSNLPPGRYLAIAQTAMENEPDTTDKLRLPDAMDSRLKLRRDAENLKLETELKACQNVTDFRLPIKPH